MSSSSIVLSSSAAPNLRGNDLQTVFVYGSLLADEVVHVLLKRVPDFSPATLNNYHRFSVKGRVYPAILPVENKKVTGRVLFGITIPELDILDAFEDVEYVKKNVDVSIKDGTESLQAWAYAWANSNDPNLYGEWDFEEWKGVHMEDFVKMTMDFIKEWEQESRTRMATYESYYEQNGEKSPVP